MDAAASPVSACEETRVAELDSYMNVSVPGTYWVDMIYDQAGGAWKFARSMKMPERHSTHLRLTNLGEYSRLDAHRHQRLRFTIEVDRREVREVPDRAQWQVTYEARVSSVCSI